MLWNDCNNLISGLKRGLMAYVVLFQEPEFSSGVSQGQNCLIGCCKTNLEEPRSFQSQVRVTGAWTEGIIDEELLNYSVFSVHTGTVMQNAKKFVMNPEPQF